MLHSGVRPKPTFFGFSVLPLDSPPHAAVSMSRPRPASAQHSNAAAAAGPSRPPKRSLVQLYPTHPYHDPVSIDSNRFVLGRDAGNDLVLNDPSVSRQHAELRLTDEGTVLLDLDSTNGISVNGSRAVTQLLANGDRIQIGSHLFCFLTSRDDRDSLWESTVYSMVTRDGLTHVYHRRYLEETLRRELARCRRHGRPLALILLAVDHFAAITERHGSPISNQVLCQVARRIENLIREDDLLARSGETRFALTLVEVAWEDAIEIAERCRIAVGSEPLVTSIGPIRATISLGIAGRPCTDGQTEAWGDYRELLREAEERLLEAGRAGSNRIVC